MRLQNLYRHNKRILQEVIKHHTIEDIDSSVITARSEKRVLLMILNIPNSFVMVLQIFVWLRSHVHVEPNNLSVVSSQDEVVTTRVARDRRDPLGTRLESSYD
jgi:hypothetical protein